MKTEAAIKFWCLASLAALTFKTVSGAGLTSDQLFNFAPLPAGSLPDEPLFTPDLRACVFSSIHRSLSNLTLSDSQINARFLRLLFHDCASGGCNGSIMKEQEQKAFVNTFLSGYDQVRIVKSAADAACGTTLSYADTIVAGGFTGVYLSGGPNATQYVRLGRVDTDGLDDPGRLPSAFTINDVLISIFAGLGLHVEELVALSGAHTLGKATCANVTPRIAADPYADPSFLYGLTNQCRTLLQQLSMDLSPTRFDNSYYKVMTTGKGILLTDEGLYFENTTTAYAAHFALNQTDFFSEFTVGLLKMSLIGLRPPSITNLSAGIDHTMPINASIFLNGTASFYQFEIADLQAALDAQFSTPNSQVVITSILPVLGNSSATDVTFSIVPPAINYNGTIPSREAVTILAALNATAADPSKLLLNNTLWGPVQGLQVLASPLANVTTTSASPSNSTVVMRLSGAGNDQGAGPSTGGSASLSLHLGSLSILVLSTLLLTLAG